MRHFTLLIFSFVTLGFFAQSSLKGKVLDGTNNDIIENAKVVILNTDKRMLSDSAGNFNFKNLAPGTYDLEVRAATFNIKVITGIKIGKNDDHEISVGMDPADKVMGPVVVRRTVSKESVVGALQIQRNSKVLLDIVPQEVLKRTPARTVADALKQVSGASIQDNKFAVVRGLNDRYNAAYINGGPLPSSEADRKAFSFDIFPVNMLENLSIIKTASSDLPGEFAGGIIQIKTRDIPTENFQSFTMGAGYNTITTFKDRVSTNEGKLDWLGMDDGSRAISGDIPTTANYPININDQAALAKTFTTNWTVKNSTFMPNFNAQYAGGFKKKFKNEKRELGFIGSLSYNSNKNYNETERRTYTGNAIGGGVSQLETNYLDKVYSTQVLSGAMGNLAFKFDEKNQLSFKNVYSINSDLRFINRSGQTNPLDPNPTLLRSNANWMTENKIYSGQLNGEHGNEDTKLKLDWLVGYSNVYRSIPNLRRNIYTRLTSISDPTNPNPYDTIYTATISGSSVGPDYGGSMFFATTNESLGSTRFNAAYKLIDKKKHKLELKSGIFTQFRVREFSARLLGYTKYGGSGGSVAFNNNLLYLPEDSIFNPENMGLISPGVGGFKLSEGTKVSDSYDANSQLYAGYVMANEQIGKLNVLYGLRIEDFRQKLFAKKMTGADVNVNLHNLDFLPSVNMIYALTEKQNLRLSGSQTVNRPEYRELAPFAFYDFNTQFVLSGNDSLQRALITNLDARYEFYPGNGQMFTASLFFKNFKNPIEQIARPDVSNEIYYKNVASAVNYGLEMEFKMNFGSTFKADTASFLNDLTMFTNLGFIHSSVDVSQIIGSPFKTRPLQGQSPYIFNLGLNYQTESNWSISANVNTVGSRIYILGSVLQAEIWEKSRTFLDFQIAKGFLDKKLEIKLNCQNLLAQKLIFYQNNYTTLNDDKAVQKAINYLFYGNAAGDNKYEADKDDLIWRTKFGRTFSFSATYKF
jgi:TonB-dependent receptor